MKVTSWWKLSSDESYLVVKVKIVKEVKRSVGLWRFACGDVLLILVLIYNRIPDVILLQSWTIIEPMYQMIKLMHQMEQLKHKGLKISTGQANLGNAMILRAFCTSTPSLQKHCCNSKYKCTPLHLQIYKYKHILVYIYIHIPELRNVNSFTRSKILELNFTPRKGRK